MRAPHGPIPLRNRALLIGVALLLSLLVVPGQAWADSRYYPAPGTWNNKLIYMSRACHDENGGTPGGACIDNSGCDGFSENYNSGQTIRQAINGTNFDRGELNLRERGYQAILGNGTLNENVAASNMVGADVHFSVHSNAFDADFCSSKRYVDHGTWGLYRYPKQETCANRIRDKVGAVSLGSQDITTYRTNLGELNGANAINCFAELNHHTWRIGVDWLRQRNTWAWRLAYIVDLTLDYPR